jgi:hypothetical protein
MDAGTPLPVTKGGGTREGALLSCMIASRMTFVPASGSVLKVGCESSLFDYSSYGTRQRRAQRPDLLLDKPVPFALVLAVSLVLRAVVFIRLLFAFRVLLLLTLLQPLI